MRSFPYDILRQMFKSYIEVILEHKLKRNVFLTDDHVNVEKYYMKD